MSFDAFMERQRILAQTVAYDHQSFWHPLYKRLMEILKEVDLNDPYRTVEALYTERYKATDPHVGRFWLMKEEEFRRSIGRR